jgi:hypothetical protein
MRDPIHGLPQELDSTWLAYGVRHHALIYDRNEESASSQPKAMFVIHKIYEKIFARQPSLHKCLATNQASGRNDHVHQNMAFASAFRGHFDLAFSP